MFLDYAEDQAKRRKGITMGEWAEKLDNFLAFNNRDVLKNAGSLSADRAKQIAMGTYEQFDAARQAHETEEAERQHMEELAKIERQNPPSPQHKNKKPCSWSLRNDAGQSRIHQKEN